MSLIERCLSIDILVSIFKLLPKKSLLKVMRTCKLFFQAGRDVRLWAQLNFSGARKNLHYQAEQGEVLAIVRRVAKKGFVTHLNFAKNTNVYLKIVKVYLLC